VLQAASKLDSGGGEAFCRKRDDVHLCKMKTPTMCDVL
jgi:hypothetical protein